MSKLSLKAIALIFAMVVSSIVMPLSAISNSGRAEVEQIDEQDSSPNVLPAIYLPMVANSSSAFSKGSQKEFVLRLNYDEEIKSASIDALSAFGQEWTERQLGFCENLILSQDEELQRKHDCEMLKYTLAGQFTEAEIALIRVNGDMLLAVAEYTGELPQETDKENVDAAALEGARHPHTGDVIYITTLKGWWTPDVSHTAYAGVPNSGWTYNRIKLRIASAQQFGALRYDTTSYRYNADFYSVAKYHGWCCFGGGSALTEAWFKSQQGLEIYAGGAVLQF